MNDTVTRLLEMVDDYACERMHNPNKLLFGKAKDARQALEAELVRLFTPLSDEQISAAFQFRPDRTPKAFARTIENLHGIGGES